MHIPLSHSMMFELLTVTEKAAIACYPWIGKLDAHAADQAAVDAMRQAFNQISFTGNIVIGEGERDEAPMLYIGEKVGNISAHPPSLTFDIAVDPLEGTNLCARFTPGAITVLAIAEQGGLLHSPDCYMDKIAVGAIAKDSINLTKGPLWNLSAIAEAKQCNISDLTIAILDRPRHEQLIEQIRTHGAKISLISDGDVAACLSLASEHSPIDAVFGIGGAPEGVLAAAALKCLGGDFQGKLVFRNKQEQSRAIQMGIKDLEKTYQLKELVQKSVGFVASGVTSGPILSGVTKSESGYTTESLILFSSGPTFHKVITTHVHD